MVLVALVGASTGFGRTMLNTFLRHNNNKHEFVVISRSENAEITALGVEVRPVDYNNHEQLVKALQGVHTVLSVIGGSADALRSVQLALIPAMQEAGVKRFAPSEYAFPRYQSIALYAGKVEVWNATKKSGLEYTRFSCGIFMSAFATGTPKPKTRLGEQEGCKTGEQEALAGMRPWNFIVNMKAGTADYAGDGTTPLTFTDMRDVSLFVLHALDLEHWPEELGMQGDNKSFAQAVAISERVQKRKWLTKTNSIEEMEALAKDEGEQFYNQVRLSIAKGDILVGNDLNKAFPQIKPITCDEFIEKWWSGVELPKAAWEEDQSFM